MKHDPEAKHSRLTRACKMTFRANIMSLLDVDTKKQEFSVEMILIGQTRNMKDIQVKAPDGTLGPATLTK